MVKPTIQPLQLKAKRYSKTYIRRCFCFFGGFFCIREDGKPPMVVSRKRSAQPPGRGFLRHDTRHRNLSRGEGTGSGTGGDVGIESYEGEGFFWENRVGTHSPAEI